MAIPGLCRSRFPTPALMSSKRARHTLVWEAEKSSDSSYLATRGMAVMRDQAGKDEEKGDELESLDGLWRRVLKALKFDKEDEKELLEALDIASPYMQHSLLFPMVAVAERRRRSSS